MPDTKYTTQIYLAVRQNDAEQAGAAAARVYQDFLGRLRRNAPGVTGLRLELDQPAPRKGADGVFECWSNLKAQVPHDLTTLGADGHRNAWRAILKSTFATTMYRNQEYVEYGSSRVEGTRPVLAADEAPVQAAPKEEKPKELIAIKVFLGGTEHNVQIPKGENLLDGVNDKGVAVKWDCKSGVCDTCKVLVTSGMENLTPPNENEVNMLGDDLIKQGYRLSCQMNATGPCTIKQ